MMRTFTGPVVITLPSMDRFQNLIPTVGSAATDNPTEATTTGKPTALHRDKANPPNTQPNPPVVANPALAESTGRTPAEQPLAADGDDTRAVTATPLSSAINHRTPTVQARASPAVAPKRIAAGAVHAVDVVSTTQHKRSVHGAQHPAADVRRAAADPSPIASLRQPPHTGHRAVAPDATALQHAIHRMRASNASPATVGTPQADLPTNHAASHPPTPMQRAPPLKPRVASPPAEHDSAPAPVQPLALPGARGYTITRKAPAPPPAERVARTDPSPTSSPSTGSINDAPAKVSSKNATKPPKPARAPPHLRGQRTAVQISPPPARTVRSPPHCAHVHVTVPMRVTLLAGRHCVLDTCWSAWRACMWRQQVNCG
eukprot:m.1201180 g.1201180  ORF g.1201180 m.1201180 type:complete len:373 (+) comp24574_c0_seq64:52-1170(+)